MKCVSSLYDVYYKVAEVVVRRVGHYLVDQEETVVFTTDRPQKGRKTEVSWKFHIWFGLFTSMLHVGFMLGNSPYALQLLGFTISNL